MTLVETGHIRIDPPQQWTQPEGLSANSSIMGLKSLI